MTSWRMAGMIDRVRYPWAMVPPNGPAAARSGSTWIHWWSPVASANRSTCAWSITCQSDQPRCVPASAFNSSMVETVVVMAPTLGPGPGRASLEPHALVLAAVGMEEQGGDRHHEPQVREALD